MIEEEKILDLTVDTFDNFVKNQKTRVLVDFWASWCQPCKKLHPVIQDIANIYSGRLVVAKLDVGLSDDRTIIDRYDIKGIPLLMLFEDGDVIAKKCGGRLSRSDICAFIDEALV